MTSFIEVNNFKRRNKDNVRTKIKDVQNWHSRWCQFDVENLVKMSRKMITPNDASSWRHPFRSVLIPKFCPPIYHISKNQNKKQNWKRIFEKPNFFFFFPSFVNGIPLKREKTGKAHDCLKALRPELGYDFLSLC